MEDYILMHHGILGQKWGVRRYQNPDGTLTLKGKQRLESRKTNKINSLSVKKRIAEDDLAGLNREKKLAQKKNRSSAEEAEYNENAGIRYDNGFFGYDPDGAKEAEFVAKAVADYATKHPLASLILSPTEGWENDVAFAYYKENYYVSDVEEEWSSTKANVDKYMRGIDSLKSMSVDEAAKKYGYKEAKKMIAKSGR